MILKYKVWKGEMRKLKIKSEKFLYCLFFLISAQVDFYHFPLLSDHFLKPTQFCFINHLIICIIPNRFINLINILTVMDQRLYHYEYRRPRYSNPTYASNNVSGSMTFFMGGPSPHSTYEHMNRSNSNYQPRQPTYQPTTPRDIQPSQSSPGEEANRNGRTQSHLSSYGNNSLAFNEREIFDKQNSKFNIISLKPKEVPDKIKQYPKFSLENKDSCYYQKMQLMREQEMASRSSRQSSPSRNEPVVAGKHTYVPEENKNPSYYQHGRYFTPRMLNHADEVSNIM